LWRANKISIDFDQGLRSERLNLIILIPEDHFSMYHTALFEGKFWVASALDYLQDSHAKSLKF
jgi:hypothetical protein